MESVFLCHLVAREINRHIDMAETKLIPAWKENVPSKRKGNLCDCTTRGIQVNLLLGTVHRVRVTEMGESIHSPADAAQLACG